MGNENQEPMDIEYVSKSKAFEKKKKGKFTNKQQTGVENKNTKQTPYLYDKQLKLGNSQEYGM